MTNNNLTASQVARISLWQQVNASLLAYNKLVKAFFNAENAIDASPSEWQKLGIHKAHLERHRDKEATHHCIDTISADIKAKKYQLIFHDESAYPQSLCEIFDPPPLLFVRGNIERLQDAQIAIVGSRKPTPHAQKITFDIAQYLVQAGYVVTSGLAQGVDCHAHIGALTQTNSLLMGRTIGVMGTGIDVCYPKQHNILFNQIIEAGGCLISELLPSTPASKHTFPRRNRIVAGLSLGTIVTEAALNSGSLITARLTSEQGKQVFALPSHIDNKNAEGCHHLIREGATLIYHPEQVLEDIKFQQIQPYITPIASLNTCKQTDNKSNNEDIGSQNTPVLSDNTITKNSSALPLANAKISDELHNLFSCIDWTGIDLDKLVTTLGLDTQTLLVQLMELELMGLIRQEGGRYVRV